MLFRKEILNTSFKFSNAVHPPLTSSNSYHFLTDKFAHHHDLIFIRHAESIFNKACEDYRKAFQIPYVWKQLCNHEGFDHKVLYNTQFMDAPLTQKGKTECKKTEKTVKNLPIDCILVSPQLRALQTCQNIFEGKQVPVFVQPLLVGPLRSCCDVNRPTNIKKAMFPEYDFSQTQNYQELWYLDYLSIQQQKIFRQHFQENRVDCVEDQRVQIVHLLKEGKVYEDALTFRKRVQGIKQMLRRYKQRYKLIAIVTHYYTIEYLGAMSYQSDGSPHYYVDIKNCTPYYSSLGKLLTRDDKE